MYRQISLVIVGISLLLLSCNLKRTDGQTTTELHNETLVITAYEQLLGLYIDGQQQSLTNGDIWNLSDYIHLQPNNRLIAVEASNLGDPLCRGILASVYDGSLLTNSKWKCTLNIEANWTALGFNDSSWPNAVEYGRNGNHRYCNQDQTIGNISSNSKWIWTSNAGYVVVFCRGYLPLCENSSPCLNNGTCLPNDEEFCQCSPQFTGAYCETELHNETLVTTAYEHLLELYIDGQMQQLINGNNWTLPDYTQVQLTNRLIALRAAPNLAYPQCGGVLASLYDGSFRTNSEWKCREFAEENWQYLGFDDSIWPNAVEYGSNGYHTSCDQQQFFGDISSNSKWIWIEGLYSGFEVFCRGYLPFCEYRSPCLNNGTCLQNNQIFCKCLFQYTGQFCESEIPTTQTTEPFTTEFRNAFTTDETRMLYTSDVDTLLTTMNDISREDPCNLSTGLTTEPTVSSTTDDPCTTINTEVEITTVETTAQPTTPTVATTTTQPLDLCNPSPCRNGATCMDIGNTFTCTCVPGFTGTICDVEINECESNPCYPFGKCTDLIGDYNCTCNPGYEVNDTKTCDETNFCALESEPCENGGTCVNQNALNRYFCLCPVLNDKQYVGLHCETVLVTSPIVHGGISPTSGIIAGGASVTIRGQGLDLFEPLGAYLIDTPTTGTPKPTLYAYVIPNLTLSDSIAVQIPPADIAYVDLDLLVIVEYTGPINVTSDTENLRFKYTGNPVITTIEPKEILVSGGVHLTISGSNMDTVQNPVMEITTFVVNKTAGNSEKNFSREICSLRNTSTITCLIPQGIVPSSFINDTESVGKSLPGVAHLESLFRHKRGRRTKRAPVANLTDDTGNTFEMYLGFIFDQYPTYNNISKSLPHVTLSFVQPKISFKPGVSMDFVSNKQDIISLYGSGFTHGCSMDDYQVNISDAPCIVNSLTDNELQCRPPKEEPKISDDSMHCEFDQHPVMVHVGDMSYLGCCVSYTTDYTDLIIGVTVICVVVVAIIILVAVLVYKRHKNQRKGKGSDDDSIIAHKPIGVMSPTPAHVHTQSDDYDDVITSDVSNVDVSLANQTTVVETRSGTRRADIDYLTPRDSQVEFNSNDIRGDRNGRTRDSHAQVYRDRDFLDNAKLGNRPISEPAIDYWIEDDPDY